MDFEIRFWSKVNKKEASECWEWLAAKDKAGYGAIGKGKKVLKAHRVAWELTYGTIPDGMFVCHKCDYPSCTNPFHLFLGTNADNVADMDKKGRRVIACRYGEDNHLTQLTEIQVREIFDKHWNQNYSQRQLAKEYNVSRTVIRGVTNGKTWSHLKLIESLGMSVKEARVKLNRTAKGYCRPSKGENNNSAKITSKIVLLIRGLALQEISQQQIASQFGISQSSVSLIILRKTWNHV